MSFETTGLIHMMLDAGWVVRLVLVALLVLSIASWSIMIMKFCYIKRACRESIQFTDAFWKSRNFSETFLLAKRLSGCPVARVFRAAFVELKKLKQAGMVSLPKENQDIAAVSPQGQFHGRNNIQRALRRSIYAEMTRLSRSVPFLATVGNTAPFIGLFGTVWGIMNSFQGIGQRGTASLAVVAPGISEALVATAAGLAVAIPAVMGFNYFVQKIRIMDADLQNFSADFLNIVERDILNTDGEKQ
jgi:biopolymer transport protein TolQ